MSKKLATPLLDSLQKQPKMKSIKMYRIELKSMEWHLAKDIAVLAAFSNGSETKLSLDELSTIFKVRTAELGSNSFTLTINGSSLLIDKGTENLLHITQIEAMELDIPQLSNQEAKDILTGVPTIDRYTNTGIADTENHELLN